MRQHSQKNKMKNTIIFLLVLGFLSSCQAPPQGPLPIYGRHQYLGNDTIYHSIPDFELLNQDSVLISNESFSDHIYLADFFFTSCPSICPKVTKQMLRLYDHFEGNDMVKIVSYTLDPVRDDVAKLNLYSRNLEVETDRWHFLTGEKDSIWDLADDYFVAAVEDPDAPGGFDHSGKIILVDKSRHIRGFAEGTDPEDVTELIPVIEQLIKEYADKD